MVCDGLRWSAMLEVILLVGVLCIYIFRIYVIVTIIIKLRQEDRGVTPMMI